MEKSTVLITGGTGSFGQAFLRDILTKGVKQVRVYSRDELKQAQLQSEIRDERVRWLIGDIRDYERLLTAMDGVDLVVHAAAMKRIEKCEADPQEAIKTNLQGSVNVANAALKANVKSAVLLSTDKAAYPVNLYGATKLAAEKVWIQSNIYRGVTHPTKFSVVRYGNVLGSRGSVIENFKRGVLKVTDREMTRFFLTLSQAVDLVQLALTMGQGGEIFVPNLKSVAIYDLALLFAGKEPIEITNQRGGEKLHESLITKEESNRLASYANFNVINPEFPHWPYEAWSSPTVNWSESSETAERYETEELRNLLNLNR